MHTKDAVLCRMLAAGQVECLDVCRHHVCRTIAYRFRFLFLVGIKSRNASTGLVHNGARCAHTSKDIRPIYLFPWHDAVFGQTLHWTLSGECKPFVYAQKHLKHIDVGIVVNVVSVFGCVTQIFPKKFSVCEAPSESVDSISEIYDLILLLESNALRWNVDQIMHSKRGCSMWRYPSLMR